MTNPAWWAWRIPDPIRTAVNSLSRTRLSQLSMESYTIFGQVIKGMDVVENLTPRDPSQSGDLPPGDKILSVTIEEK